MFPSLKSSSTRGKDNSWWIHLDGWRPLTIIHDPFIPSWRKLHFFCWLVSSWTSIRKINLKTIRNLWFCSEQKSQLLFKADKQKNPFYPFCCSGIISGFAGRDQNTLMRGFTLENLHCWLFMQWRPIRNNHPKGMEKSGYQYSCRYQQLIGCCQIVQRTWNWVYFKQSDSHPNILAPFSIFRWRATEIWGKGNRHEY